MNSYNFLAVIFFSWVLIFLTGCQNAEETETPHTEVIPDSPHEYSILVDTPDTVISGAENVDIISKEQEIKSDNLPIEVMTGAPIESGSAPAMAREDKIYNELFENVNERAKIKVDINFDAAGLADVIPAFAEPLKLNYILDAEIAGTVTMKVNATMTQREVWQLFERIIHLAGAYCEYEDKVLHIRPASKITKESGLYHSESNIEVRIVPLKYASAAQLATQLSKFTGENNVTALENANALLILESRQMLDRLLLLTAELDVQPKSNWAKIVLPCKNVSSDKIKAELLAVLPVLGFPVSDNDDKEAEPGGITLVSLPRIQAIIASAATSEALQELNKWVTALDRSDIGEQERVYVYDVINADAGELLQALSAMFPVEGSVLKAATATENGAAAAGTESVSGRNADTKTDEKGNVIDSGSIFDTTLYVFADAKNNRMLIRTTPRVYAMVKAILNRIDTIPDRILLQVLVVTIELNDSNEFGVEFSMKGSGNGTDSLFGTNFEALTPSTETQQTGGHFYLYNPDNPDQKFGYIRALAGRNKMKVLSSPQIVATSHTEAKISVGKRVPIVTSDITDTASNVNPDNTSLRRSYQYEDTGIILTVTPRATKGGLISMDVDQVISEAVENTMKGIDSPIIKEDQLKTTVAFRSGRTLIMGGLIKEKVTDTNSSLPVIADIPFLRTLAGNSYKAVERTEILVLITATIITEDSSLQTMVRRYVNAVDEIKKFEYKQFNPSSEPDEK